MSSDDCKLDIVGGGLAGSEAALQLAKRGYKVRLYDMKPVRMSPAHHNPHLAEIVCSNSFGAQDTGTASGLIKREMLAMGCELLKIAEEVSVPAGKALAVDRDKFSELVTRRIQNEPNIELIARDVSEIPENEGAVLLATGPLTSAGLVDQMALLLEREQLYFFDAASPIVAKDSINFDRAFVQDRYALEKAESAGEEAGAPDGQSYINCPFEKDEYFALIDKLLTSEKTELKTFEKASAKYFESCLPVEVIASRGPQTLRFGPMKPVGLVDPHTGRRPYAAVQLRQDNSEGTLYNIVGFQTNLKWGAQKEMIQMIPGLENAEIVRYGVMHRNTYIHSPEVLLPTLQLKKYENIFFAGQLTGTEGYTESIATGMFAAFNMARLIENRPSVRLPRETMLGALLHYITRPEAINEDFQPINSNWGILPELTGNDLKPGEAPLHKKDKKERNARYARRSAEALSGWMAGHPDLFAKVPMPQPV